MKVSLDDGKTWVDVNTVRVIQDVDDPTDNEEPAKVQLHINLLKDKMENYVFIDDGCDGSDVCTYLELGDRLVNGG